MVLVTLVAAGVLLSRRACRMRRQKQLGAQQRMEEAENIIQTVRNETAVHGTRLDAVENGTARLQEQAASTEEEMQRLRSGLQEFRLMVQYLGREASRPTVVVQTDAPGLRETIVRETQERGIEFSIRGESDEEGPQESTDQDSDGYPGR